MKKGYMCVRVCACVYNRMRGGGGGERDLPLSVFANGSHGDGHISCNISIHSCIHGVHSVDWHIDRQALIGLPLWLRNRPTMPPTFAAVKAPPPAQAALHEIETPAADIAHKEKEQATIMGAAAQPP